MTTDEPIMRALRQAHAAAGGPARAWLVGLIRAGETASGGDLRRRVDPWTVYLNFASVRSEEELERLCAEEGLRNRLAAC